ncbi:MAG: glycosyltransferase [Rhizobiaceae bacterium]
MTNTSAGCTEERDGLPTMLFVRDYRRFSGGHLKYCDHLAHVAARGRFRPLLHVTPESNIRELDALVPPGIERVELPLHCDAIFVAGTDWAILDSHGQDTDVCPVVNLIQGVRHADPSLPLFSHLNRPALRICVSREVADAIQTTGRVSGPVQVIENGLDHAWLSTFRKPGRKNACFVAGLKDPVLAKAVGRELSALGIANEVLAEPLPRKEYLSRLANFELAVLLPLRAEGFYLPALEAMALGVNVVMPDCIGARAFAVDGETCSIALREPVALAGTAARLFADRDRADRMRGNARIMSRRYDIEMERRELNDAIDGWIR